MRFIRQIELDLQVLIEMAGPRILYISHIVILYWLPASIQLHYYTLPPLHEKMCFHFRLITQSLEGNMSEWEDVVAHGYRLIVRMCHTNFRRSLRHTWQWFNKGSTVEKEPTPIHWQWFNKSRIVGRIGTHCGIPGNDLITDGRSKRNPLWWTLQWLNKLKILGQIGTHCGIRDNG